MSVDGALAAREVTEVSIVETMRSAYLDYAMSVIVGRALPDVRDGLKPVHRRTLYAMGEAGNDWNKPYKKSARIVGEVLGKYHPHGGEALYDALVRMAQDFSLRYPLVDGQGNFGSVDGDNPAAMRYTEVRMAKIAHTLLDDIDKDTVDFAPNYDGAEREPTVLPAKIPNLLINGATGIAVGVATNIPPHNLAEVAAACRHLLKHPDASIDDLMRHIPAPDFPTAAMIYGLDGVREAYYTGRGRVVVRARAHFETTNSKRPAIIVDELPYQVNKAALLSHIADLVREKKLEGIADLRDESDRSGMRMVIELRRGENAEVILNKLYKETQLQDAFGVNMVALVDGAPQLLNLRRLLLCFLAHRREVAVRRAAFELRQARRRAHLLEGLAVAVANVDEIIALIKNAPNPAAAKEQLLARVWESKEVRAMLAELADRQAARPEDLPQRYGLGERGYALSPTQAQAILDMRLARLTALERDKIFADYAATVKQIADLIDILDKPERVTAIIGDELSQMQKQFGDKRRSEIVAEFEELATEDLIAREEMAVTLSHKGYIKAQPVSDYGAQLRGGRGRQAAATRDGDFIDSFFTANSHDYILCFSSRGRVYWQKVYELPRASRASRGRPIVNLLPLMEHEKIQAALPVRAFDKDRFVVMATARGVVKKTSLAAFSRPLKSGIIALNLDDGDYLINATLTGGGHSIMLLTDAGRAARFAESKLRAIGRTGRGVRGIKLLGKQQVVAMLAADEKQEQNATVLIAAEDGYGKRTGLSQYPVKGRGTQGVVAIKAGANSPAVGAILVLPGDEVMLITGAGVLIRTAADSIRQTGRAARGVRLLRLDDGTRLVGVARVEANDD